MVDFSVAFFIVANVICSLGVIFANKYLFSELQFPFTGLLTGFHFIATSLMAHGFVFSGYEEKNSLETNKALALAGVTCVSIFFQNLSLFLNSVGFYQVTKLTVIPCTLLLQYILYKMQVSGKTQVSLLVVTLGVGITTVTQVDLKFWGFIAALIGVTTTSLQQIVYSVLMKDKKLNSVQLYYHIGPWSALFMLIAGYFLDKQMNDSIGAFDYEFSKDQITWVIISCFLAAPMNYTSAFLLSRTSPITFQVLGHFKTVLVFVIGVMLFDSNISIQNIVGIIFALLGVFWYSKIQIDEKEAKAKVGP